jgi:hypothetical protein
MKLSTFFWTADSAVTVADPWGAVAGRSWPATVVAESVKIKIKNRFICRLLP